MSETAPEDRGFTLTRTFDAPRAKVWRAITEADLFARWFGADVDLVVTPGTSVRAASSGPR